MIAILHCYAVLKRRHDCRRARKGPAGHFWRPRESFFLPASNRLKTTGLYHSSRWSKCNITSFIPQTASTECVFPIEMPEVDSISRSVDETGQQTIRIVVRSEYPVLRAAWWRMQDNWETLRRFMVRSYPILGKQNSDFWNYDIIRFIQYTKWIYL